MALRSPLTLQPYDYIGDSTGRPLDKGQIYIGVAGQDPEFYQVPVFLDAEMTKPIDQPIRTNDGFVDFAGSLSELYASAEIYSVKVLDKQGRKVLYKGDMTRKNLMSDALADLNQSIIDAQTAAQITLNAAVNSANTEVAQTVSLATAAIDTATTKSNKAATDADAAIKTMFENGGLPATPFATKALMTASALADGQYAMVTDETANNGLYVKTSGAWVKSSYDPLTQAKTYVDMQSYANEGFELIKGNLAADGYTFSGSPTIATSSDYLKVSSGDTITLKGDVDPKLTFSIYTYDENKLFLSKSSSYSQRTEDRVFPLSDGYIKITAGGRGAIDNSNLAYFNKHIRINYSKIRREYVETKDFTNKLTVDVPLEVGYIEKTLDDVNTKIGYISSSRHLKTDYNFLGERRSRKFLSVLSGTPVSVNYNSGSGYMFEYDKDYNYIENYPIVSGQDYVIGVRTKYIKLSFWEVDDPYPVVSVTFESRDSKPEWVYNVNNYNRAGRNNSFIYEAYPNQGRQIFDANVNDEQYSSDRYFNTGIIKLPPNYDPLGAPVRLMIFVQGSGGYLSISSNTMSVTYDSGSTGTDEGIFNYFLNEGYAILGVYPWTSKYPISKPVTSNGTPTAMAAYKQAYEWALHNYNIRDDGVFVSGKSSGGYCGALLSYNFGIPVLATALLAPTINAFRGFFGPYYETRKAYVDDFGFEGDHTLLAERESTPTVKRTPELYDYVRANAERLVGYNPYWCGLINVTVEELIEEALEWTAEDIESEVNRSRQRICPVPIKIWAAKDDTVGTYDGSYLYVQSIRNAQGNAEMRTMPNDMGGHYSVDVSELAPRVATITTKLGIEHKNIALAMVEIVQYFRRFG